MGGAGCHRHSGPGEARGAGEGLGERLQRDGTRGSPRPPSRRAAAPRPRWRRWCGRRPGARPASGPLRRRGHSARAPPSSRGHVGDGAVGHADEVQFRTECHEVGKRGRRRERQADSSAGARPAGGGRGETHQGQAVHGARARARLAPRRPAPMTAKRKDVADASMDTCLFQFCQRYQTWLGLSLDRGFALGPAFPVTPPKVDGPAADRTARLPSRRAGSITVASTLGQLVARVGGSA